MAAGFTARAGASPRHCWRASRTALAPGAASRNNSLESTSTRCTPKTLRFSNGPSRWCCHCSEKHANPCTEFAAPTRPPVRDKQDAHGDLQWTDAGTGFLRRAGHTAFRRTRVHHGFEAAQQADQGGRQALSLLLIERGEGVVHAKDPWLQRPGFHRSLPLSQSGLTRPRHHLCCTARCPGQGVARWRARR